MKKLVVALTVLLALGVFISVFFVLGGKEPDKVYNKVTSEGLATIDITPKIINDGKFIFSIAVNTHSVSLQDYNLMELTKLSYDGKSVNPFSTLKMTGHHNLGELVFDIGNDNPSNFKIIITGIPDKEERVFEWN